MSQRRTGCKCWVCPRAAPMQRRLDVLRLFPVEGIDGDVQRGRTVDGRHEEGAPDQRVAFISEDGVCPVCPQVPACGGGPLRFGQRRMTVELFAASQKRRKIRELGVIEFAEDQHVHARTLTRYRDGVGRPRTPKGMARVVMQRLAEEYPGTAKELCALDARVPVPVAGGDDPVGPEHRRPGQHGDARALRRLPGPGVSGARQPGGGRGDHPLDRVLPRQDPQPHRHGCRGRGALRRRGADRPRRSRHRPGGGAQDGQRGAQRVRSVSPVSRSTPMSCG